MLIEAAIASKPMACLAYLGVHLCNVIMRMTKSMSKALATASDGIWGHSSVVGGKSCAIASSDIAVNLTEEKLRQCNVNFKRVINHWEGKTETSWIISWSDLLREDIRDELDGLFNGQECIIHLGPCDARDRRPATQLSKKLMDIRYLGLFQAVTIEEAQDNGNFTYDASSNTWFIAKR